MEIIGKIVVVLPVQTGANKSGKAWSKQVYVLEETDARYPQKVVFELFGEQRIKDADLHIDEVVKLYFSIDGSEYNGKWYSKNNGFRVEKQ
ncbi:hypothetical protein Barb6_03251 [Bacteroidales bacterium Barb6]|nr:hypothetical protein Barb4_04344 [Bacteroidales bacterium Barb4]OAV64437.1 hypothetical protein Barb6_03251 [Bacteroidales bacterium Barb6]